MEELRGTYIDIGDARTVEPVWVIENLLPLGLTILGAPPKSGKSTWTMIMASIIADWHCKALPKFLSKPARKGPTMVLSAEAQAGELRYTLEVGLRVKAQSDGSILIVEEPWEFMLDTEHGAANLMFDLERIDPRLVIIDPFANFHTTEEKDAAKMIGMLRPIRQWAVSNDAAVVVVHHTAKPPAAEREKWKFNAADLRGSGAIFGIADGVLMLTPKKDNDPTEVLVRATFKRARGWESELRLAAWDSELKQGAEAMKDLDKQVLRALKTGMRSQAVQEQLHMPEMAYKDVVAKLKRNGWLK